MALDVYVMPLWRFKAGDFRLPIETVVGIQPKVISPEGVQELPQRIGWFARWRARRAVRAIRKTVDRANNARITWVDDGEVVYAEQSLGFESLRAFAYWLDCRDRLSEFEEPPNGNYYEHPVWKLEVSRISFPHLVEHDCYSGYYLPCEFERTVQVEPYLLAGRWPTARSVGSTTHLMRELEYLQSVLQLPDQYEYPTDDPLLSVKQAYIQLREIAHQSLRHGLPVIFWG